MKKVGVVNVGRKITNDGVCRMVRLIFLSVILLLMSSGVGVAGGSISKFSQSAAVSELYDAIGAGDVGKVRELIAAGVDLNPAVAEDELTPFEWALDLYDTNEDGALLSAYRQIIIALIEGGVDASAITVDDYTLLQVVIARGDGYLAGLLLTNGADPHVLTPDNRTTLHLAALHLMASGTIALVEALIDAGVGVNSCDDEGRTMLHYLMLIMRTDFNFSRIQAVINVLISRGIDLTIENIHGNPAMDIARRIQLDAMKQLAERLHFYIQMRSQSSTPDELRRVRQLVLDEIRRVQDIRSVCGLLAQQVENVNTDGVNATDVERLEDAERAMCEFCDVSPESGSDSDDTIAGLIGGLIDVIRNTFLGGILVVEDIGCSLLHDPGYALWRLHNPELLGVYSFFMDLLTVSQGGITFGRPRLH